MQDTKGCEAFFTSVRVVCNNTLQLALNDTSVIVKVPHATTFDSKTVKEALNPTKSLGY